MESCKSMREKLLSGLLTHKKCVKQKESSRVNNLVKQKKKQKWRRGARVQTETEIWVRNISDICRDEGRRGETGETQYGAGREVGSETRWQGDADSRVQVGKKEPHRDRVMDWRGLFAFVVPTSFISGEQPPSAERLYDRNQSEANRPYSSTGAPTHRYTH